MSSRTSRPHAVISALTVALLCAHHIFHGASAKMVDEMEQGFLFDWAGDETPPIPTAAQCDTLHITWGRRSATGPNPEAPYYLQIYTSAFIVPFVVPAGSTSSFDWPVPFVPGTQFQICMFANNGVTGGCQAVYTVYPASGSSTPTCQNLTYPAGALDVTAKTQDGSWSQYGWIPQCSDITITPNNGTPPYTYTIAPTLRPPFNFTSDNKDSQDWTVSLAYGSPFWLSVIDSNGWSWTNGPLHSGSGSVSSCLSPGLPNDDSVLSTKATIGVGVGALAAGVLIGTLSAYLFFVRKREQWDTPDPRRKSLEPLDPNMLGLNHPHSPSPGAYTRASSGRWGPYDVEPFVLPHDASGANTTHNSHNTNLLSPTSAGHGPLSPSPYGTSSSASDRQGPSASAHGDRASIGAGSLSPTGTATDSMGRRMTANAGGGANAQVYVVHHDAGRPPPVTVFTSDGTEVVELPPQYESAALAQGSSGAPVLAPPPGGPRRQPKGLPAKMARVASNGDPVSPS
ncbi:hypothetical protein GSI_07098 [Ganoderma sinense ZZ0214-1]|uniref:Transporter n=1 Tax=Ganoderma sinense ZZ0214-1 TaxID=1077348 RepID=A0A2G8SAY9_9APHY|nr:hypothetical protein GSI_07098 [Ganoderma sinense ZZ0214-1]